MFAFLLRSDLATVATVQPGPYRRYRRYLSRSLRSVVFRSLARIQGVHSISGGQVPPPPLPGYSRRFEGGGGGVSPLFGLHACTLCMLVLCEIRGVFRDLLARILGGFPPDPAIYQCFSRSVPCGRRWSGLV